MFPERLFGRAAFANIGSSTFVATAMMNGWAGVRCSSRLLNGGPRWGGSLGGR